MIYKNENLTEISFPLGGIGTGCIGLGGNGMLIDWEIFNRPNKGGSNSPSFFAVTAEYPDGRRVVKVLQGDSRKNYSGMYMSRRYAGFGFGPEIDSMCGYPHFESVIFDGRFPTATLTFSDKGFPGEVVMEAWSPFIPLDSENSSIPVALFDISVKNGRDDVKYEVVFSVRNPFDASLNNDVSRDGLTAVRLDCADKSKDDIGYGDLTVAVDSADAVVLKYRRRGSSKESAMIFCGELESGKYTQRNYSEPGRGDVCAIVSKAGSEPTHFALSWSFPNCCNYWDPVKDENGNDVTWKNHYATRFENSTESCFKSLFCRAELYEKTVKFKNALHSSFLDPAVIDAAASNLSVLRSPTVMRLENGALYGFEGVHEHEGSCEGTCTHVWSYAYALCFLFPDLERSIRETEFRYDVADCGRMRFRTLLPLGRTDGRRPHCLDGQMMTVVKSYREWKISGDDAWLEKIWPTVKKVLEYAWNGENYNFWDRDADGILEGRQHHTLDADLLGPSSWLEGLYLLALKAGAEMAEKLGDEDSAEKYMRMFSNGYDFMKNELFCGEYFIQKIDVSDKGLIEKYDCADYYSEDTGEVKYQIADGSEIDQMLAQWHSNILGLGDIYDKEQRATALSSMMKYNFKPTMRDHVNNWRVFALDGEGGTVMCCYPKGINKPVIPVQYADECMTGFEYAFAGLLISEGKISDGLRVVRAVRDRYDGKKRNPYNEIECGSNYARSMASFALLPIFCGFSFDLPKKKIGFQPVERGDMTCFWSVGTGWGNYIKRKNEVTIEISDGFLRLSSVTLDVADTVSSVVIDGKPVDFIRDGKNIVFSEAEVRESIIFR